jgi:hypothetical protein
VGLISPIMDRRNASVAAMLGAALGLVITPFMASVWANEPGVIWSETTFVTRTFGPALESSGLLSFGTGDLPYQVYGKCFFLVYLLMIPVIRAVRPRNQGSGWTSRVSVWSWWAVHGATWVAAAADFTSYWGYSVPGTVGDRLWGLGFGVELLALLTLFLSIIVFSLSAWRGRALAVSVASLLLLAVLAVVPVNLYVTRYAPNSLVVPLSMAWAVIGVRLLVSDRRAIRGGEFSGATEMERASGEGARQRRS